MRISSGIGTETLSLQYSPYYGLRVDDQEVSLILQAQPGVEVPPVVQAVLDGLPDLFPVGPGLDQKLGHEPLLGRLADATDILFVFHVCSLLPMLGLLAIRLPRLEESHVVAVK